MKLFLPLIALAALAVVPAAALANDTDSGSAPYMVASPHGGYSTIQSTQPPASGSLFGNKSDTSNAPFIVPNPHGSYNTIQSTHPPATIPFFGKQGFAHNAMEHADDPKYFVLVPKVIDDGHGKHTVYQKVYYATPEDAAAAKAKL
jgi:hypothetical protein